MTKESRTRTALSATVCLFFLLASTLAHAAGGINWKLEFRNVEVVDVANLHLPGRTGIFDCQVSVHYGVLGGVKSARILSGETYVFEFGLDCPVKITGYCGGQDYAKNRDYGLYFYRQFDIEHTDVGLLDLPACYNTKFRLCKGKLRGTLAACKE